MAEGVLRDSVSPFDIPLEGLAAVAGYGDGAWQWTSAAWARFQPPIVSLSIVVSPGHVGDIADCESGDWTPGQIPDFVRSFNRPGRRRPTVYCNRVTWPLVVRALQMSGLDPVAVDWWIATLDGTLDVWYGSPGQAPPADLALVAVQWKGSAQSGGPYDESVILDPSWVGGDMALDPKDPVVVELMRVVNATYWQVVSGYESDPSQGTPARYGQLKDFPDLVATAQSIHQQVAALPGGPQQYQPVLDAIAGLQASLVAVTAALKAAGLALEGA